MRAFLTRGAVLVLLSLAYPGGMTSAAFAQSAPTAEQLIEALKSKGTRGLASPASAAENARTQELAQLLATLKAKATRGLSVTEKERATLAEAVKDQPQIDLEITFDFNSPEISERVRPLVMSLGKALTNPDMKTATFIVAGHTDAKGSATYNQALSEKRAQAVKDFLVTHFSIPEGQLIVVGYGSERLKDAGRPYADSNRRVQVVNAGAAVASAN